jgi:hypothetical protein
VIEVDATFFAGGPDHCDRVLPRGFASVTNFVPYPADVIREICYGDKIDTVPIVDGEEA